MMNAPFLKGVETSRSNCINMPITPRRNRDQSFEEEKKLSCPSNKEECISFKGKMPAPKSMRFESNPDISEQGPGHFKP